MHDMGGKLLSGIRSIHVDSKACVRSKGGESECFRMDCGMRQGWEGGSEISGGEKRAMIAWPLVYN